MTTDTYLVRRRGVATTATELQAALTRLRTLDEEPSTALDARWLHSYALREADGSFGLACVFRADGIDALRRHAVLAALPAHGIQAVLASHVRRPFAPTKVYLVWRRGVGRDPSQLAQRLSTARRIADEDMPRQVSWLRSYALREDEGDALGTACLYQAVDPGALREHALRAGLPVEEITPVFGRIVFREDLDPLHLAPDQALSA
ncbi:MAG: nickel-binding protein [Pseudomonadota bacterium]